MTRSTMSRASFLIAMASYTPICRGPVPRKTKPEGDDAPLVSKRKFEDAMRRVLGIPKEESDRQMAKFQASNRARRARRKP